MAGVGFLDTLLALTNIACATICVNDAFWSAACDCVWFGNISGQAVANWVSEMVDLAGGPGATGTGITGIGLLHALLILADITRVTVVVSLALWSAASDGVWFWDETGKAVTNGVS